MEQLYHKYRELYMTAKEGSVEEDAYQTIVTAIEMVGEEADSWISGSLASAEDYMVGECDDTKFNRLTQEIYLYAEFLNELEQVKELAA